MATKTRRIIIVAGICLILISIAPFVVGFYTMAKSTNDAKTRVRQLDHIAIRDAGHEFVSGMDDKSNRMLEYREIPDSILQTDPKFVHFADGVLHIEYGGGFAHYGLAIPRVGAEYRDGSLLTDGIFFYEAE